MAKASRLTNQIIELTKVPVVAVAVLLWCCLFAATRAFT